MGSIFDSITVPGASLDVSGPSGATPPPGGNGATGFPAGSEGNASLYAAPAASPGSWTPPAAAAAPVSSFTPAAGVASTGLIASVEPDEFAKIVWEAGGGTVLRTPVQMAGQQRPGGRPPEIARRYAFPFQGIVFVTLSRSQLDLGPKVRVVDCLAVAYDGKPLGGGNATI